MGSFGGGSFGGGGNYGGWGGGSMGSVDWEKWAQQYRQGVGAEGGTGGALDYRAQVAGTSTQPVTEEQPSTTTEGPQKQPTKNLGGQQQGKGGNVAAKMQAEMAAAIAQRTGKIQAQEAQDRAAAVALHQDSAPTRPVSLDTQIREQPAMPALQPETEQPIDPGYRQSLSGVSPTTGGQYGLTEEQMLELWKRRNGGSSYG